MITGKQSQRGGQPLMTRKMLAVMQALRDSKAAGYPFVSLKAHKYTIKSLILRDWIVASKGHDGVKYTITGRGLKALKVYESPPPYRNDGLCPGCGVNPRYQTAKRRYPYCKQCISKNNKRQHKLKGRQRKPDALCPGCKSSLLHVYPSGSKAPYCHACLNVRRKAERARKHQRLLERIAQGEFIPCIRCKKQLRYHTAKSVYDYCYDCYRAYMNNYHRERNKSA